MSETKTKKVKDLKAGNTVDTTFLTMEKEVTSLFEPGDIVRIKDVAERSTEKNDITEFSRTLKNIDFFFAEIVKTAEGMENEYLKRVVFSFLNDADFINTFKKAPCAKIHHHNYIGGLIDHTQSVVALCKTISGLYPELDRDSLLTGAILHDIGKTAAYEYTFRIDVTEEGGLVDHIVLGYRMVEDRIKGFSEELSLRLLHLILSHYNYGEWGLGD